MIFLITFHYLFIFYTRTLFSNLHIVYTNSIVQIKMIGNKIHLYSRIFELSTEMLLKFNFGL